MPRQPSTVQNPQPRLRLVRTVILAIGCRLLLNTARRFGYAFAPAIARGLGVSLTGVTSILAANQAAGILALLAGPLADRWGHRAMMLAGLGLLAGGMALGALWPSYGAVMAGLLLAGLGKNIFDPALQAYVGDHIPFERRGLVMGLLEIGWAGSSLLGIPLIGLLMARWGWRAPFFALAGLAALGLLSLALLLGAAHPLRKPAQRLALGEALGLLRRPAARAALGFGFCFSAANDILFVVYGAWLESAFGLSVVALGFGASVIGIAELGGELATAMLADRLGLRRAMLIGLGLSALCYALLPAMGFNVAGALIAIGLVFLATEFTIVSGLSICTELLPEARATMMAGFFAAAGLGRVFGALIGGPLWLAGGIGATAAVSALLSLAAFLLVRFGMRAWRHRPHAAS